MLLDNYREKRIVLPPVYLPAISYFIVLARAQEISICTPKNIQPTLHAKTYILGANGLVALQVPLDRKAKNKGVAQIHNGHKWRQKHWQSIQSAYGKTPYFNEVETEVKTTLFQECNSLWLLNINLLQVFCQKIWGKTLSIKPESNCANSFNIPQMYNLPFYEKAFPCQSKSVRYLSILDLFCNLGSATLEYLIFKSNHLQTR